MGRRSLFTLICFVAYVADSGDSTASASIVDGEWEVVAMERDGATLRPVFEFHVITFDKKRVSIKKIGGFQSATATIDEKSTPPTIDIVNVPHGINDIAVNFKGIFTTVGKTLILHLVDGPERPKGFSTRKGDGTFVLVCRPFVSESAQFKGEWTVFKKSKDGHEVRIEGDERWKFDDGLKVVNGSVATTYSYDIDQFTTPKRFGATEDVLDSPVQRDGSYTFDGGDLKIKFSEFVHRGTKRANLVKYEVILRRTERRSDRK